MKSYTIKLTYFSILTVVALLAALAKPLHACPPHPPYNPPYQPGGGERAENEEVEPVAPPHLEAQSDDQK